MKFKNQNRTFSIFLFRFQAVFIRTLPRWFRINCNSRSFFVLYFSFDLISRNNQGRHKIDQRPWANWSESLGSDPFLPYGCDGPGNNAGVLRMQMAHRKFGKTSSSPHKN